MPKPQLRAEQGWIFDNFLMLSENEDVLHPGIMGTRVDRGFMPEDLKAVYSRVSGRRSFPKAWAKRAAALEAAARSGEAAGRPATARHLWHRAALCYGRAQHLIPVHGNAAKTAAYEGLYRSYDKVIAMSGGMMEKAAVPFGEGGHAAHAVLHRAPGGGRKPTVVQLPGMDAIKEDVTNPFNNYYAERGMNVCAMDGPGQGECNFNAAWQTESNYEQAVSAVIDWLVARDDVDPGRIGVMGMSMGSRWGVLAAARDDRIRAVCGQMANVGPFDLIFEQAQPNFKRIFMYMTNYSDEAEFDKFTARLTQVRDAAKHVACPHLLVAGDMDELCSPEDIAAFRANLAGPTELWLYEGVFHPMGEVAAEIYPAIADWLLTTLDRGRPAGYDRLVYVEEGASLHGYEHG